MAEIDERTLEAAKRIVAEAEQVKKEGVRVLRNERLEQALEMALTRCAGDIEAAANLFERWCESDSTVRDELLRPMIRETIERRLADIPHVEKDRA